MTNPGLWNGSAPAVRDEYLREWNSLPQSPTFPQPPQPPQLPGSQTPQKTFTGRLYGEEVELPNVRSEEITYTKREPSDTATLRREFNSTAKKEFLQQLSNQGEQALLDKGLSNEDIRQLQDGLVPDGYQVHHKMPLDDSGDNSPDNLILIKNDPYHKAITNYQNSETRDLNPGESKVVEWPMPDGDIYTGIKE